MIVIWLVVAFSLGLLAGMLTEHMTIMARRRDNEDE